MHRVAGRSHKPTLVEFESPFQHKGQFMNIPTDKLLHFLVGSAVYLAISSFAKMLGFSTENSVVFGFCTSGLVSVAKEVIWDKILKNGTPDFSDAYSGILGAVFTLILMQPFE